jgi:alpha-ketoglutaric semialdehyde dehydrogenase
MNDRVGSVLIAGEWRQSAGGDTFEARGPADGKALGRYPFSPWLELEAALAAGTDAHKDLGDLGPEAVAAFLERLAERLEEQREALVELAHSETALPREPRLGSVELPRTTDQLRQGASAVRGRSWRHPVISPGARIGSIRAPVPGVVCVFGPNNFPFAFNAVGGGDFAAAIATGHPVLAKANPGHPGVTALLAEEARAATAETGLPPATVQMVYRTSHGDGARLVADPRVAATAYTGSRAAGLALKRAADEVGNLIYLEMSSVNPVVILPGAIRERCGAVAEELVGSMLAGAGQFCTSPGLLFSLAGPEADELVDAMVSLLDATPGMTLLGPDVVGGLEKVAVSWVDAGARKVTRSESRGAGCSFPSTMMAVDGATFLDHPETLQSEAFGNMSLVVSAAGVDQLSRCLQSLEGNLTGSVYSSTGGDDDRIYADIEPVLRQRVGRLLNDKVPTGVAVVAAMNHGGPYPSTGHPGFTAVGMPASLDRFTALQCYDGVPDHRLPDELKAANPLGLERYVDGEWTREPVTWDVARSSG